jgi:hypothetical protein
VLKSKLLASIQREIQQHDFPTFVDEPGTVQRGRPACKKRLNTVGQFLNHLCDDAMRMFMGRLSAASK